MEAATMMTVMNAIRRIDLSPFIGCETAVGRQAYPLAPRRDRDIPNSLVTAGSPGSQENLQFIYRPTNEGSSRNEDG
jgi:hypothetical protein